MKTLKNLLVSSLIVISLNACNEVKLPEKIITDPPLTMLEDPGYVAALGKNTLYVLSGTYRGLSAGTCLNIMTNTKSVFLIAKLLQDYECLRTPETLEAAKLQLVKLSKQKSSLLKEENFNENTRPILPTPGQ